MASFFLILLLFFEDIPDFNFLQKQKLNLSELKEKTITTDYIDIQFESRTAGAVM